MSSALRERTACSLLRLMAALLDLLLVLAHPALWAASDLIAGFMASIPSKDGPTVGSETTHVRRKGAVRVAECDTACRREALAPPAARHCAKRGRKSGYSGSATIFRELPTAARGPWDLFAQTWVFSEPASARSYGLSRSRSSAARRGPGRVRSHRCRSSAAFELIRQKGFSDAVG